MTKRMMAVVLVMYLGCMRGLRVGGEQFGTTVRRGVVLALHLGAFAVGTVAIGDD